MRQNGERAAKLRLRCSLMHSKVANLLC